MTLDLLMIFMWVPIDISKIKSLSMFHLKFGFSNLENRKKKKRNPVVTEVCESIYEFNDNNDMGFNNNYFI